MNRTNRCLSFSSRAHGVLGSARVSRAGEGILPSRTSQLLLWADKPRKKKSSLPAKCGNQHATSVRSPERHRRVIFIYQMNSEPNIASSGVTDPGYRPLHRGRSIGRCGGSFGRTVQFTSHPYSLPLLCCSVFSLARLGYRNAAATCCSTRQQRGLQSKRRMTPRQSC